MENVVEAWGPASAGLSIEFIQRGDRAYANRVISSILTNDDVPDEVRATLSETQTMLMRLPAEVRSGGDVNRQNAQEETDALEPVVVIDPDTGQEITTYRQIQSRGNRQGTGTGRASGETARPCARGGSVGSE